MNINLVNLNDAVYRLLHRKFDWLANVDLTNFNKTNCPLLHEHDPREVVTYKDFVTILAGNPNVAHTTDNWKSRCLAKCDTQAYNIYKPWGRTFGKYKGKGGKVPLAEVKPLDEMFWYYDALDRQLRTTISNTANACRLLWWYHNNGWQFRYSTQLDNTDAPESGRVYTLIPGVYGCCNMAYSTADSGFNIIDDSGPTKGEFIFTRVNRNGSVWRMMNAIFFVDSPVKIKVWWAGGGTYIMQGILFRITPPGYWE